MPPSEPFQCDMALIRQIVAEHNLLGLPYNVECRQIQHELADHARLVPATLTDLERSFDFWDLRTITSCEAELDVFCRKDKLEIPRTALDWLKRGRSELLRTPVKDTMSDLERGG